MKVLMSRILLAILLLTSAGCLAKQPATSTGFLPAALDQRGPYLVLLTPEARKRFPGALTAALESHPQAKIVEFESQNLGPLGAALQEHKPYYALLMLTPEELTVDFVWQWLTLSTEVDDDPFVDVRAGFITGSSPESAEALVRRAQQAAQGELQLPAVLVDDLGPNTQVKAGVFQKAAGSFFIPIYETSFTISHASDNFIELDSLDGAGLVHFGGHGYPDRIVEGLQAKQITQLKLKPCVVFNGACYTGVTCHWYDEKLQAQSVKAEDSFCLELLKLPVVGYLAALHPDHGMPVYQEMEFLAYSGASLGEVIKFTHDGVVLGFGGRLPSMPALGTRSTPQQWTPAEVMLYGTASRILYGDPAFKPLNSFAEPPYKLDLKERDKELAVTAKINNLDLKSSYTDTFYSDLGSTAPFNERVRLKIPLPESVSGFSAKVIEIRSGKEKLTYRLIGAALEKDGPQRWAHIQVDCPAEGFFQSRLRQPGTEIELLFTLDLDPGL
jgi:hypothetical protein